MADVLALDRAPGPVFASDVSAEAIESTQANAQAAKVLTSIELKRRDVRALPPTQPPGVVVTNPPFGERIGARGDAVADLYAAMGERFRALKGHDLYVLAPVGSEAAFGGLEPVESLELWNGPIETRLLHFRID